MNLKNRINNDVVKKLIQINFATGSIPEEWMEEERNFKIVDGCLHTGKATRFDIPVPGGRWHKLDIQIEFRSTPESNAVIVCGDNTLLFCLDMSTARYRVERYATAFLGRGATVAQATGKSPPVSPRSVLFDFDRGRWSACLDENEVLSVTDPQCTPMGGLLRLEFRNGFVIESIAISGHDQVKSTPQLSVCTSSPIDLEVSVDFQDDLMRAPFDAKMLDSLFAEFKSWGVSRCHWQYEGGYSSGWWQGCPYQNCARNYIRTVENVGEIFPAAVKAAHEHGIEIFGWMVPFDMGFLCSLPDNSPQARKWGKQPRTGGPLGWICDFPTQHPELAMSRKPSRSGPGPAGPFTRIDLVKEDTDPAQFTVHDISIYVSDDNARYTPYPGPVTRTETIEETDVLKHSSSGMFPTGERRASRVMRLDGLNVPNRYVALHVESRKQSFTNRFSNLVRVFTDVGEEQMITYGVHTRGLYHEWTTGSGFNTPGEGFIARGIEFDNCGFTITALSPGLDFMNERYAFDHHHGLLAFARGKDTGHPYIMSPSFPESRRWWLSWLKDMLDTGADGVEIRVSNHSSPMAWSEYGFEAPVVERFKTLHGINILETDAFDRAEHIRLRGEAYTEFYREARALVNGYGRKMGLHVSQIMDMEPEHGAPMDIHMDWRTWISEGLADSITMKSVRPGTRFSDSILEHAAAHDVPVRLCLYANVLWDRPGGEKVIDNWIKLAEQHNMRGFQFYECASVVRASPDGRVVMEQSALKSLFQSRFT